MTIVVTSVRRVGSTVIVDADVDDLPWTFRVEDGHGLGQDVDDEVRIAVLEAAGRVR